MQKLHMEVRDLPPPQGSPFFSCKVLAVRGSTSQILDVSVRA
jgi:hypothetical protein